MFKLNPEKNIQINQEIISKFLELYDIYDFTFKSIDEGISNNSFLIESNNKKYVLRVYSQDRKTNDEILLEIKFQDYLRDSGIKIPLIYKNNKDEEFSVLNIEDKDWQFLLMEFVEGNSINSNIDRILISDIARTQANMHLLGVQFTDLVKEDKNKWADLKDTMANRIVSLPVNSSEVSNFVERVRAYNYILNPELPYGYNHLDLDFDGNIIVLDNKVNGIIDFDDLSYSPSVVCLGYSLWNILDDEGVESMNYYLEEYQKIRQLNNLELDALPNVIMFRNYVIGIIRLLLWEEDTPLSDIEDLIKLEKQIPNIEFRVKENMMI
ncbi:MAG: phosphotransferase [Candidatus Paceibacterota bacterium]